MNAAERQELAKLEDVCKERDVGIVAVLVGRKTESPFSMKGQEPGRCLLVQKWEHFEWDVTLLYNKRSYKTTYRMGIGHATQIKAGERGYNPRKPAYENVRPTPPTAADVLSSLCSDATSADRTTFEDWCSEFGYDTDSRWAERCYNLCVEMNAKLRAFLGEDFDLFASAEH